MDKKEILKISKNLPDIVAIAPNAFSRVVPGDFFPNFSIVCFKYRQDTDIIAKDIEIYCVEKEKPETKIVKMNAASILGLPDVKNFINKKKDPHLLVYKPTPAIETAAYQNGWKIIGNSATVKYSIENKKAFRILLEKAGIRTISGETVLFDNLNRGLYKKMVGKYGSKLVFQVCEITTGGGTGTAFINSISDFDKFIVNFTVKRRVLSLIEHVNITKFIEGTPTSIIGCATKYGVITGNIQTQILDIADVRTTSEGSGLFSGHDFGYGNYNRSLNLKAKNLAEKLGSFIYKNLGYKGIFGLDLITNVRENSVYPVECNPRYTDAFPLISEIHNGCGALPMDVFHIFEHMGIDYKIDVEEISAGYKKNTPVSQIILETKTDKWTKVTGDLKAGVYKINKPAVGRQTPGYRKLSGNNHQHVTDDPLPVTISYLRPGYRFEHLKGDGEFLITEGVPFKDTVFKGGARLLRLIFRKSILEKDKKLTPDAKAVIDEVYEKLSLQGIEPDVEVKDFLGLRTAEIPGTDYLDYAIDKGAEIVNVEGVSSHFGYVRPAKISWGLALPDDDAIKLVRAKRLQKHIKYWLNNMDKYGLSHEVKDHLSGKEFSLWYEKYHALLSSKEKANIKINPNWMDYKIKMGKKVGGIFLFYKGKFLGGNVFTRTDENFTVCYGIVEKIKFPNWSLGAIVDFLCIKYAIDEGCKRVGFGQDNNLYGYHLSTGLLQYKLNLGLTPYIKDNTKIYSTKFVNTDKLNNTIAFLGIKNGKNVFYVLEKTPGNEVLKLNTDLDVLRQSY